MKWVECNRPTYVGNCLEIGSLYINGGVSQFFNDAESYFGIDMVKGRNVDIVTNAHDLHKYFHENSTDTIIWLESAEHDPAFWKTAEQVKRILKPNGFLLFSAPTIDFPYHYSPDLWRFTSEGIAEICKLCGTTIIKQEILKDTSGHSGIIAICKKEKYE